MALNFPDAPTVNQVYTDTTSGFSFKWDGTVWQSFTPQSTKEIAILDDISGSFNDSTVTFSLTKSGIPFSPANAQQLRIVIGGVIQTPITDYTISSSTITFTTAPSPGLSFSGVSLGPAVPIGTAIVADGSITPIKLSTGGPSWNTSGDLYVSGITTVTNALGTVKIGTGNTTLIIEGNARTTGVITATTFSGNITGTAATFTGNVSIAGTLTYEDVTNVDSVGLVTARAGAHVATVSGNLLVGSTSATGTASQLLQVTGGAYVSGNLGVGVTNPSYKTHIVGSGDILALESTTNTDRTTLKFLTNGSDWEVGARGSASSPGNAFYIYDNAASAYRQVIDSSGNVLLGTGTATGTASQPLQVNGGAYFSGNIGIGATNPAGFTNGTQLGLSGYNAGGGVGYHQFLAVTNTYGSATNPSKFFRLNSTGGVEVVNNAYTTIIFSLDNSGNISVPGNVSGYSDKSLKDNIQTIPNALDKVSKLRGVEFDRNDIEGNPHQIGVIAQEVEEIIPEVITTHNDGLKSVAYGNLVGLLIEAIKDLKEEVNELKARLEEK